MKTAIRVNRSVLYLITAMVILASSCSTKMNFSSSSVVPGASGTVKVKNDKNNNYSIQLKVTDLPAADKLSPPRKEYVVWMVSQDNMTKNIGKLYTKRGLISKARKASLKTVTTYKPGSFLVTAEDDGNVEFPGPIIVLRTN